jgi:hypothetical protein
LLYVVAMSFLPSVENSTPATGRSTGIHRLTCPLARSSSPMRGTGRFRSSTAAVLIPGATATYDHRSSSAYFFVPGFSSQYVRSETARSADCSTVLVV